MLRFFLRDVRPCMAVKRRMKLVNYGQGNAKGGKDFPDEQKSRSSILEYSMMMIRNGIMFYNNL